MKPACHYGCGTTEDLAPYGPEGSWVCVPCASATPERKRATEEQMGLRLRMAGPRPTLTDAGYLPLDAVLRPKGKA